MRSIHALLMCALVAALASAKSGPPDFSALFAALDRDGTAIYEPLKVKVSRSDYRLEDRNLEALSFQPAGGGPFPALLLIPGHGTTARDWTSNALAFAQAGYASLVVSQPGYGKSDGPADFVGPFTIRALTAGYRQLQALPFVDPHRMGIVGYSRGAIAAALLATQLDDVKAVVLGAGIYDFQQAYDESVSEMIKENMRSETGMTPEAVAARSAVLHVEQLQAPVLILHGEKDINAPVSQAYRLRDRLTELGKEYEIHIFPESEHSIGLANFRSFSLDFLNRKLAMPPPASAGPPPTS